MITACVFVAAVVGSQYVTRPTASTDVSAYVPADAESILWVPILHEFTSQLMLFSRGIQEIALFRDLLKAETGVVIVDSESIRDIGVDPEAGLALVWRSGHLHLLIGVQNEARLSSAIISKFENLGYRVQSPPPDGQGALYSAYGASDELRAAFDIRDGLMVLVYAADGTNPVDAITSIYERGSQTFFQTDRYQDVVSKVGESGVLLYSATTQDNATLARLTQLTQSEAIPSILRPWIRPAIDAWLRSVEYVAGSIRIGSCETQSKVVVVSQSEGVSLIPRAWRMSSDLPIPDMASILPRDTVLFTRQELRLKPLENLLRKLAGLTGGIRGLLGAGDPTAEVLGKYVHPELNDRHVVKDVFSHLTGHLSVAFLGIDRRAPVAELIDLSVPQRWLNQVQLVLGLQVRDGSKFWARWWPKRTILETLGYAITSIPGIPSSVADAAVTIRRMCTTRDRARTTRRQPRRTGTRIPCETYGILRRGDLIWMTTGAETLERLLTTAKGDTAPMPGLTREPLAKSVLGSSSMFFGGYFSFDGLLKAVENRNLPGGATRYLAQMFEMAFLLDTDGNDLRYEFLLTR
ncbi:MAG: hypothetical protein VX223_01385 [Myxococcota bacterium]|nr:hypothetical protein [Myxococcota bacterium]